jgi:Zn-dependent protease
MNGRITLGRAFGASVQLDWSWLIALAIFFASLLTHHFGAHPAWSLGLSFGVATIATLGLAISLAVRELVHALVARRLGIPISGVTLHLLGGVPLAARDERSPRRELIASVVGPLTSFVIGATLLVIVGAVALPASKLWASPATVMSVLDPASTVIAWLAIANLVIAALHALPAFPLDGGRALRALLWEATGNYVGSTRIAARIGQGAALGLLAIGIASAFRLGPATVAAGIWMMFFGWFLLSAASSYHHGALIEERLGGLGRAT